MAKDYGDLPTVKLGGTRHITKSATECLCGARWLYGTVNRSGKSDNIAWRTLESVDCQTCKKIYEGLAASESTQVNVQ